MFERLRQEHVFVVGDNAGYLAVVKALLEMGIRRISTWSDSPSTEESLRSMMAHHVEQDARIEWQALSTGESGRVPADCTAVIFLDNQYGDQRAQRLFEECRRTGKVFLSGGLLHNSIYAGPLTRPDHPGCFTCTLIRQGIHSSQLPEQANDYFGVVHATMLGYTLAYWLFCHLTNIPTPDKGMGLIRLDLDSLTTSPHILLPWPDCPVCGGKQEEQAEPFMRFATRQEGMAIQSFIERSKPLIDEYTGILSRVDEDGFEQLPLYQARATVRGLPQAGIPEVDLVVPASSSEMARYLACRTALATYAQLLASSPGPQWWTSNGSQVSEPDVRAAFATGLSYWEWVSTGILEIMRQQAWNEASLEREPFELSGATSQKLAPYIKMLRIRFGIPVEIFLLHPATEIPGMAIAGIYDGKRLLDIAVDTEAVRAIEQRRHWFWTWKTWTFPRPRWKC